MSKWIDRSLSGLKVAMVLGQIGGVCGVILGLTSFWGIGTSAKEMFVNSDDVVILVGGIHVSNQALQSFPIHVFIVLQGISLVIAGLVVYYLAKTLRMLFNNLQDKQYFTNQNRLLFKTILKIQLWGILADVFGETADFLATHTLHRTTTWVYSTNWVGDLVFLLILLVVYYVFTKGLELKQDVELTI